MTGLQLGVGEIVPVLTEWESHVTVADRWGGEIKVPKWATE